MYFCWIWLCSLAGSPVRDLLNARYGWDVSENIRQELGYQTIRLEKEFNRRAGFTKEHDRLPEWMTREELAPHNAVFDVTDEDLWSVFE